MSGAATASEAVLAGVTSEEDAEPAVNQVVLRGRVSGAPEARELPSGSEVVGVRITVRRDRTTMTKGSRQKVDWLDCTAWSAAARRTLGRWEVGDLVEIEGSLRRRFPRGGGVSRVEVEVLRGRRLSRG
jgi:single-strand DNA-binding protein